MGEDYQPTLNTPSVLFERDLGVIEITGPDRVSWLQGMVSNDVVKLEVGQGCYAAHLSPQGRIISHMVVLADRDVLWLQLERENVGETIKELDKLLIMEEVEILDRSDEFDIETLHGVGTESFLESSLGVQLGMNSLFGHRLFSQARIVSGDLGYDLIMLKEYTAEVRRKLLQSGAVEGQKDFWDCLRIEAGMPVYGVDLDRTTLLPELGEKAIDYDKGCYIGQEVVAKIKYIGHVNRQFLGLKFKSIRLPIPKSPVWMAGKEIGYVTSSARSVSLNSGIALAFLRDAAIKPGTEVDVLVDGETQLAVVSELPFAFVNH